MTVYPVIDQSINIDIPEKDVRIDVYRASGAGGQHVNKTESAVRITHLPTGIAVACQTERSQHQNRANCWDMLKSKLYEIELEKKKAETGAFVGEKSEIGWGHQIRSYVLQPYQLVKDLRTGVESRTPPMCWTAISIPSWRRRWRRRSAASRKKRSKTLSSRRRPAPGRRAPSCAIATGRVLLIHFVLPNMTFWATPGGGVEPGETLLAGRAARTAGRAGHRGRAGRPGSHRRRHLRIRRRTDRKYR